MKLIPLLVTPCYREPEFGQDIAFGEMMIGNPGWSIIDFDHISQLANEIHLLLGETFENILDLFRYPYLPFLNSFL